MSENWNEDLKQPSALRDVPNTTTTSPASPQSDPLTKEAEASVRLDGDTHCVDDAPQSDQPCELHRKLNCQWMTCQAAPASQQVAPAPEGLREAASKFAARVRERCPEWFEESDTDFSEADHALRATLAQRTPTAPGKGGK